MARYPAGPGKNESICKVIYMTIEFQPSKSEISETLVIL
jgi:hypothetical protein